jgi:hypothetical protein
MDKLLKVKKIANNCLYLDDSSDYASALWDILSVVAPELFVDGEEPELKFIDDAPTKQ